MKRSHIFSLVTVFCFLLIGAGDSGRAQADDSVIRIASGRKGFTYRAVYARNLEKLMPGYKFAYLPSEGSGQNLDLLAMGKADVAFAQADVFAVKQSQEAERYRDILRWVVSLQNACTSREEHKTPKPPLKNSPEKPLRPMR